MIQPLLIPTAAEKRIDTDFYVEGYATTFDKPYLLYEWDGNKYYERIDRNALAGADMSDVIMQYNHEGKVLARLSNGTLGVEANDIAVIHNQPPVISGSNADLGTKRGDFTYQYSVTDPDGDTVNVVEKIDGKTIATKNAITLGATQTLSVSGNTFTALTNAQHTITITATDSAGNSAVRTLTFTKSIAGFVITLSTPLEANSQPTRANIKVTRDIPAGGTFKVEATNNPFDASPVWEDCTNAVVQGVAHVFTNKINTAAQYGMNIRVTVQRGDALTACWVSGIGGNFE